MGVRSLNNSVQEFLDTFLRSGTDAVNPPPPPEGLTATGGIISDYVDGSDVYRAHIFTSSGAFDVTAPGAFGDTVDYLVIAGGGGGGGRHAGGGGAGGFRTATSFPVNPGSFPAPFSITVGSGGAGASDVNGGDPSLALAGSPSSFGPI